MPRPRSYDRERAVDRAVDAFRATGYTATSMRDLLAATGVPPASLYAEFGGKDGLFLAALDRYIDESRALYEHALEGDAEGLEALRGHLESYRFDGEFRGCLLVNSLGERTEIPAEALARMDAFFGWVRDRYARHFRLARDRGELRPGSDPDALASALLAFDQGLAVAGKLPGERPGLARAVASFLDALEDHPSR